MDLYIKGVVASGSSSRSTTKLMKTGQTTSYRTGDDGDLEVGRNVDFTTLAENNVFGNTNRFTDELGGQTYTKNIVIDWSTYDGSTVLGWRRTSNGIDISWNSAIDAALLISIAPFTTGWRLPNIGEIFSICYWDIAVRLLNYAPFNNNTNEIYWTSTTTGSASTQAAAMENAGKRIIPGVKTTTTGYRYLPCRTFTVTGTTLS